MERKQRAIPGKVFGQIVSGLREPQPFFELQKEAVAYMEGKITQRRENFIEEYRKGFHGSAVLTYEPALDREVYKELRKYRLFHTDAYQEVLQRLNSYTKFQVETFIGERLNVGLSKFRYDLRVGEEGTGVLHGEGMQEPLIAMIERGRDTRDAVGKAIDEPRQEAEVEQFRKIEGVMGNLETLPGTTIVSFSPPGTEGSSYAHNFYDVFILREAVDATGEKTGTAGKTYRYVEARRYASGLSVEESLKKADELQNEYSKDVKEGTPLDAYFISRPLVLGKDHDFFDKPDELHKVLQGDPKAMSSDDFHKKVLHDPIFSQMLTQYMQTLEDDPGNKLLLDRILNALMNRADEAAGLKAAVFYEISLRRGRGDPDQTLPLPIMAQINHYGGQEVRQTTTGCGASGGFRQETGSFGTYGANRMPSNMSPFNAQSNSNESSSNSEMKCVTCPFCSHMVDAIVSSSEIECPDCHAKVAKG